MPPAELLCGGGLLVAAAFLEGEDFYSQVDWNARSLRSEQHVPTKTPVAPQAVPCSVNVVWKGRTLMTPIGGGVQIEAEVALRGENLLTDEDGDVAAKRSTVGLDHLADGQWWWD